MKIVMVTPFPGQERKVRGGVAGVSYYLAHSLVRCFPDLQLEIVAPSFSGENHVEEVDGISVHRLRVPKGLPPILANITSFRSALSDYLDRLQPDIVHFQGAAAWGYRYKKKKILTIHGIPEKDIAFQATSLKPFKAIAFKIIEGLSRRDFDNTIIINKYVLDIIGKQLGKNRYLIPNPIEEDYFKISRTKNKPVVLFGGVIKRSKNVLGVLAAFRKVAAELADAELWIAGHTSEPAYYQECQDFVTKHNLENKVKFLGELNVAQMQKTLGQVSVLTLLSHQETAPLVISEALAGGVPVVASDICGVPHMIEHGVNGFVVNPDNTSAVANYWLRILRDPETAKGFAEKAKAYALEAHHPESVARKTMDAYQSVLNDQSAGRQSMSFIARGYIFFLKVVRRLLMLLLRPLFKAHGKNFIFDPYGKYSFATISVGDDVYIGPGAQFSAPESYIQIGNKVMFGPQPLLIGGDHNAAVLGKFMIDIKEKHESDDLPIIIEDDVWVGARVTILKGVTVGRGSIIAAGALLNKSVPPYSIVGGIPARKLKMRWTAEEIKTHERSLYPETLRLSDEEIEALF